MKKKKDKKKKKEKPGPVQLSKVCLCELEVPLDFSSKHLICPVVEVFITPSVLSSPNRNLSLLFWTVRKYKILLSVILFKICNITK